MPPPVPPPPLTPVVGERDEASGEEVKVTGMNREEEKGDIESKKRRRKVVHGVVQNRFPVGPTVTVQKMGPEI